MKILLIILTVFLVSCATKTNIVTPPGVIKPITLDARVFELCDKLIKLPEKATFDELLSTISVNAQIFAECANKQKVSIELLKQLSNKKD